MDSKTTSAHPGPASGGSSSAMPSQSGTPLGPNALPPSSTAGAAVGGMASGQGSSTPVSTATVVSTGTADADTTGADESPSGAAPSRVLHIRHLPPNTTEVEVAALGAPFGRVLHVMLLRQRNQAFLEMETLTSAKNVVNYYNYVSANVCGIPVYVQYSVHKELRISQSSESSTPPINGTADGGSKRGTVLRIFIDNMVYPVTLDVLHTIFSRHGVVLRIVIFSRNGQVQAFVEYGDPESCTAAIHELNGKNIFDRCCLMRIEMSKFESLSVKENSETACDYTRRSAEEQQAAAAAAMQSSIGPVRQYGNLTAGLMGQAPMVGPDMHHPMFPPVKQMAPPYPPVMPMPSVPYSGVAPMMMIGPAVLLVSNLEETRVTPNNLFIIFGVYGDVQRVKVLFNKKDTALVQLATVYQARAAQTHLNKMMFFGKEMHITHSKYSQVSLPREGQEGAELTKDFTGSPLHRFKQSVSHNYQNVYAPSPCLHLSNIPAEVSEEFLREKFSAAAGDVVGFRWLQLKDEEKYRDRRMALIEMTSVDTAIQALVALHNLQLAEKRYLRVSFAKTPNLS